MYEKLQNDILQIDYLLEKVKIQGISYLKNLSQRPTSTIITEMYDHSNFEEDKYGFTGFLNGGASSYNQEVRKEFVLRQLGELLGIKALNPIAYFDKIWIDDFILSGNPVIHRPHQNNGHPLLQMEYMNGKLLFSGTETASEYAGYMEGAIIAAKRTLKKIID